MRSKYAAFSNLAAHWMLSPQEDNPSVRRNSCGRENGASMPIRSKLPSCRNSLRREEFSMGKNFTFRTRPSSRTPRARTIGFLLEGAAVKSTPTTFIDQPSRTMTRIAPWRAASPPSREALTARASATMATSMSFTTGESSRKSTRSSLRFC